MEQIGQWEIRGEMMFEKVLLFLILAILWVMVVFNNKLRRSLKRADRDLGVIKPELAWGTEGCSCGLSRDNWQSVAMNRPDNTVLLVCPQCQRLWEERMSLYGNKWRAVDSDYAKVNYSYPDFKGRGDVTES